MNKIDGNKIVELMFLPITDDKVIEMIDSLGMEQPIIDEQYEINEYIETEQNSDFGIGLSFREVNGLSQDGMPNLNIIYFNFAENTSFPFDLKYGDNYDTCCKKLGRKADYYSDLIDENRIYRKKIKDIECGVTLVFTDDTLQKLDGLIIHKFNEEKVGDSYIPNEE